LNGLNKRKSILKLRKTLLVISDKPSDNLPSGFRYSSLGKSFDNGQGRASQFLTPELDNTSLGFKDVHLTKRNMIRKRQVKCNLSFTITQLKNAPNPNPLNVLARFVKIALFDKTNIVSNIHTVPAYQSGTDPNLWKFQVGSGLFSNGGDEACFVRTIDVDIKLCVLFEMVLVVKKTEQLKTPGVEIPATPISPSTPGGSLNPALEYQDRVEISCGWSLLPLFTSDGLDLETKTYNLQVYGGNPFERDVSLALPVSKPTTFLSNLIPGNERGPRLVIKVNRLKKSTKSQLK
jgi:nephrocystin-1